MIPRLPKVEQIDFAKMDLEKVSDSIDQYFTKAEVSAMCDYEKLRFRNMRKNYEMMFALGLPVIKPSFMKRARCRKKQCKPESDDSDVEWTPQTERRTSTREIKPVTHFRIPTKEKRRRKRAAGSSPTGYSTGNKKKIACEKHVYPLRKLQQTNYMDLEVPDDDHFLYCEDCNKEYDDDCPIHGPLVIIESKKVSDSSHGLDHVLKTLPDGLCVKESGIPDAGFGVWAETSFPARARFGPYSGEIIQDCDQAHASGYCWQVYQDGKPHHFVDAHNLATANWMRYVNCARTESEQNVTAFQHKGEIYYRSFKSLEPGMEMLVWYGQDYGKELGIHRGANSKIISQIKVINGKSIYQCIWCSGTFSNIGYLLGHMRSQHGGILCNLAKKLKETLIFKGYERSIDVKSNKDPSAKQKIKTTKTRENRKLLEGKMSSLAKFMKDQSQMEKQRSSHENTLGYQNSSKKSSQIVKQKGKFDTQGISDFSINTQAISEKSNLTKLIRTHTGERPYKCDICGQAFSMKCNLTTHIRTHTGERPYKCNVCGQAFSEKGHLTKHIRTHTGERPYKCDICGQEFSIKGNLTRHIRTHTGERPYKCDICGQAFNCKGNLTRHIRTHTGEKPYKCDIYGQAFSIKGNLTKHIGTHTGEKPYKCDICGQTFNQKGDLTKHIRTHTGERPYKCDICGQAFSIKGNLTKHIRTHTGERPYKCDICGQAFSIKGNLTKHIRTHTGERPYKCDICGQTFSMKCNLTKHIRTHTGERPYKCDICGQTFSMKCNLTKHIRTHTGERPYKCDIHGQTFSPKCNLTKHIRTHTGERPYKCDICGQTFSMKCNLTTHIRTHTGERPYKCDICKQAFSIKGNLTRHIRTQTGEKPYKCDIHGQAFSPKCNLTKHIRTHTGVRPYKCDICGQAFSRKDYLSKHIGTHNGERPYKCDICGQAFSRKDYLTKHIGTHAGERPYRCDICGQAFSVKCKLTTHVYQDLL